MPRDLSTALFHRGRFWLLLEPRDLWFGLYVGPNAIYAGVPCLVIKWERRPRRGR